MTKKVDDEAKAKRGHFTWNTHMNVAYLEAMITEQNNGNRIDGNFTSLAYTNMLNDLNEKFENCKFTKDHLQNRQRTLKKNFSKWYDIFRGVALSGFSWNSETSLIEAEEEVWDALIKDKPEAKIWKHTPILHYDLLFELFAKDRATGSSAITAKEKRKLLESEQREQMIDDVDQMLETNGVSFENVDNTNDIHVPSTATSSHGQFPSKIKSKRMTKKLEEDDGFATNVMSSIDKVAEAIEKSTKVMESSRPHVYTEGEIYAELMMMGMEAPNILKAYIFLTERPEKTRTLFGCPVDVRMSMLEAMMEDQSK